MKQLLDVMQDSSRAREDLVLSRLSVYMQLEGSVNDFDVFGEPLLIRALDKGMHRVVMQLIDKGADLSVTDSIGQGAIGYAFRSGSKDIIDCFLTSGVAVNIPESHIYDALSSLCYMHKEVRIGGDISRLEYLLNNSLIDLNDCTVRGEPFIFFAIDLLSPALVKLYLDRGGNLFVRNGMEMSPFTFAESILYRLTEIRGTQSFLTLAEEVKKCLKETASLVTLGGSR